MAFGVGPMDGGGSGDGDGGDEDDGGSDGMPTPEDAPATTDTLTAGGGSDDDDDDDSEQSDEDNEPKSKDAPKTTDTVSTSKPACPPGREFEYYLFSSSCKPIRGDTEEEISYKPRTISSKNNPDGSKTEILLFPADGNTTEKTTFPDGSERKIQKDKDRNIISDQTYNPGSRSTTFFVEGKPSVTAVQDSKGFIVQKTLIAHDDSFTQTSSYEPGISAPVKVITDYRDGRKVTVTFDGKVKTQSEYNSQDGWTTTKTTNQIDGITTATTTKTNPDGSVSSKNPDNTITTKKKDGTWFITFPQSLDGTVKTYHSDGRTTVEKGK